MDNSDRCASLPVPSATISSVPPAMAVYFPGSAAICASTASSVAGASSSKSAASERISECLRQRLPAQPQRSACSPCSGRDFPRGLPESAPSSGLDICPADDAWQESSLACRYRIALHPSPENIAESDEDVPRLKRLQWCTAARRSPAAPALGTSSPTRH